jgi:hypothetical protein
LACVAALLVPLIAWARQSQLSPPAAPSASAASAAAPGPNTTTAAAVRAADYTLEPVSLYLDKWPTARFDFRLLNEAQSYFNQLKHTDIRATLDGRPVEIREGALRLTESEPARAIVLIDGSLSMVGKEGDPFDKLEASRQALLAFIRSLGRDDTLSIYAFDTDYYVVSAQTSDKSQHTAKIDDFWPRDDEDEEGVKYSVSTDLYGAVGQLLTVARQQNVRNLIILSDGMQDTPDARRALGAGTASFEGYKRARELVLAEAARRNGVRIFTIAIGDKTSLPRHPDNLKYVDDDTLTRLANENMGGRHDYIDLPKLSAESDGTPASYQSLLEAKLKSTFEAIRQSFRYGYSLELPLADFPRDGKEHTLEMTFMAGQETFPAVKYPLSWKEGQSVPETTRPPEVFTEVFLATPEVTVMPVNLGLIYGASLGVLGFLALIPLGFLRVQREMHERAQARAVASSVIQVKRGSEYVGAQCPNDPNEPIKPGDVIVVCPGLLCKHRVHHLDCWLYAKSRCMVRFCNTELPIPESVRRQHGVISA